jgi:hypothetical protein
MSGRQIHYDEIEDVLASLDLLALILPLAGKQPSLWKWVIIAAHSSFQEAMVCVLGPAANVPEQQGTIPPADFNMLLQRIQDGSLTEDEPLRPIREQLDAIKKLDELRKNVDRFTQGAWTIDKSTVAHLITAVVECTATLTAHMQVMMRLTGNRKRRLAADLEDIRGALLRLRGS